MPKQVAIIETGIVTNKILVPDEWTEVEWAPHVPAGASAVTHEASMIGDIRKADGKFYRKVLWNDVDGNPIPDFEIDVDNPPAEVIPTPKTVDEIDTATLNKLLAREGSAVRGLALVMLEEFNRHAETITAILDAADNASNLSQFKTAMGAIADAPQRDVALLKTALKAKMRG